MWARVSFRFVTNHAFDRKTDGLTDSFLVTRARCMQCMQHGKNVAVANALQLAAVRRHASPFPL